MYNTYSFLFPSVQATSDLFYREEIWHGQIHGDNHYKLEMTGQYDDWLRE